MRKALLSALLFCGYLHAQTRRPVVLISIDGLRGRTLASLPDHHLNNPNLNEFVTHGAVAEGLTGVFPTVTYPSDTTFVTGVGPDRYGILGNACSTRSTRPMAHRTAMRSRSRCQRCGTGRTPAHLTTGAVSWPVTVGAQIDSNFPEYRQYNNQNILPLYSAFSSTAHFPLQRTFHPTPCYRL